MKDIPNSEGVPNKVTPEFNEDVLDFLTLLVEEYLRVEKLNKPPPE